MISAPVALAGNSRSAAFGAGRYDGTRRDHFFQRLAKDGGDIFPPSLDYSREVVSALSGTASDGTARKRSVVESEAVSIGTLGGSRWGGGPRYGATSVF